MSVAMTLPPFYAYRDNFSVTNCENFEAAGINGSRILNWWTGIDGLVSDRSLVRNYY